MRGKRCELKAGPFSAAWRLSLLLLVAGIGPTSPIQADETDVFAYYYPWYVGGDWTRHPYPNTPVLGQYDSGSAAVAERQIAMAADHGLDGFLVSWWGEDSPWSKRLETGLLKAPNLHRIKLAVLYESALLTDVDDERDLWFDFNSPKLVRRFTDHLRRISRQYFDYPSYWRINGRPVVLFYLSRNYVNFSAEKFAEIQRDAGVQLYAIGDEIFLDQQEEPTEAMNGPGVFDGYTAYNLLQNHRVQPDDDAVSYHQRVGEPLYRRWAEKAVVFPGVFPSYQDFRGNRVLAGNPQRFEQLLGAAAQWADANPPETPRAIFVTSFNEWWEGSTIEPAKEYGAGYLEAIQRFKQANDSGGNSQ